MNVGLLIGARLVSKTPESATCPLVPVKVTTSPDTEVVGPVTTPAPEPATGSVVPQLVPLTICGTPVPVGRAAPTP